MNAELKKEEEEVGKAVKESLYEERKRVDQSSARYLIPSRKSWIGRSDSDLSEQYTYCLHNRLHLTKQQCPH